MRRVLLVLILPFLLGCGDTNIVVRTDGAASGAINSASNDASNDAATDATGEGGAGGSGHADL